MRNPLKRQPSAEPKPTLRERAATLRATAGRAMGRAKPEAPAEAVARMAPHNPGFVPYPSGSPTHLLAVDLMIRAEARRLLEAGEAEFRRLYDAQSPRLDDAQRAAFAEGLRAEFRLRALAEAAADVEPLAGSIEHPNAGLLSLEAEFIEAHRLVLETSGAHDAAYDEFDEPAMPTELRVWRNDWVYNSIPQTDLIRLADGTARSSPYGLREVEILRSRPCVCTVIGGMEGTPMPGGGRVKPDPIAQDRADAIVAAWDQWQAEIHARKEALNLFDLLAQVHAAEDRRLGILQQVRSTPARSLAGLGVKARVAFALSSGLNPKEAGARSYEADEFEAFVFDLAGDALVVAGDASTAQPGSTTVATAASTSDLEYDLSACTLPQLARLYETWESIYEHLTGAGDAPCFVDSDRNHNPAGVVLDREYDRAGHFLGVIADEAARRIPSTAGDRNERLCVLVRHEMNTNGRPANAALLSELNAAIKA